VNASTAVFMNIQVEAVQASFAWPSGIAVLQPHKWRSKAAGQTLP